MLKNLLLSFAALMVHLPLFAGMPVTSGTEKLKGAAYSALTTIISADTPPPVSKAAAEANLTNRPHEVLAELCFFAGSLQMKLNRLSSVQPTILQSREPTRTQLQTLIDVGQEELRRACQMGGENSKLTVHQRISKVQSALVDVQTEAIKLRTGLSLRHQAIR